MPRDLMANRWRENSQLYADPETGLPLALGPFTMLYDEAEEQWTFTGPKGLIPPPHPETWGAYHSMVDAYRDWWRSEPWQKVYFIGTAAEECRFVKIGMAVDPFARLRQLQIGHPEPLKILAITRGGRDLEMQYHAKFRVQRRQGEWFIINRAILAEIASLQSPPPHPPRLPRAAKER